MNENNEHNEAQYTIVGTNIDEVKRLNAQSGLSYNEVKKLLASTGGRGTAIYSNTNVEEVKKKLQNGKK